MNPETLRSIAVSNWSQAQRLALILIDCGIVVRMEDLVPRCWNRHAKAQEGLRELKRAGHVVHDNGRLLLLESSFPILGTAPQAQLDLPEEASLGAALAAVAARPVPDGTACPSWDGPGVLSGTGPGATALGPPGCAPSCPGPARSSNRSNYSSTSIDLEDRSRPRQDRAQKAREAITERLAKDERLAGVRTELLRRQTPMARRFWMLEGQNPIRANQLLGLVSGATKPAAYLNRSLQREMS